jgi:hypothetical protein
MDMRQPCLIQSQHQPWVQSPSKQVLRKRFHLVGDAESGQVTSLVKYQAGSHFSQHEHPEGEEILVLEGIFSDIRGDWPAGTWLLNPEGFCHAPYSVKGCLLFVKLRQYPHANQVAVNWHGIEPSDASPFPNRLLGQYGDVQTRVLELPQGSHLNQTFDGGIEGFLLDGRLDFQFDLKSTALQAFDWFRLPPGATLDLQSHGCRLYLKENAVAGLRSATAGLSDPADLAAKHH